MQMENFSTNLNNSEDIKVPEKISEPISPEEQDEKDIFDTTEYYKKLKEGESRISDLVSLRNAEEKSLGDIRDRLGIDKTTLNPEDLSRSIDDEINALKQEQIKLSANYPGDWTLLLRDRMLDPITKDKFVNTRESVMSSMRDGEPGFLDKPKGFKSHYEEQILNYDSNIEKVFNSTEYVKSADYYKTPENLGRGSIGETGTVFNDSGLNTRQKNIIEAHEKGHGLRDFTSLADSSEFVNSIDRSVLLQIQDSTSERNANYLSKPDEIAERMSQLKNYFGFNASDVMTRAHLGYAKKNYIKDVGLDNGMSEFFSAITSQKEEDFLRVINKYPL